MTNARLSFNITDEDVAGKSFEPVPADWYDVTIDNVEEAESKSEKNNGKPMYVVYFKSLDERFNGTQRTHACLWYEARFTIIDLMKATGFKVEAGELSIPDADEFIGKELAIKLTVEDYTNKDGEEAKRNNVKSFRALGTAPKTAAGAKKAAAKGKASGGFAL